ncbi:zonular occludens toxin domain-containing protein [Comamonas granuli]|uniref:zonular occludens toxin domain-containing protein n=1 Tax=Comamonas granuli TaxID=290309 RepID=UPI0009FC24DA|nr:zonular occludens toxin domain-containing protein [Comamonas granuli]
MLYLVTGANGAGKTLNTLKWVRERQIKEGRPVCHNGRFEPVEGGELSSWKKIDIQKWQDEPDGTIFLVDECHNDFPQRPASAKPPEYVQMLAEHRRRGFDFYLVTQHPQNIDSFVRRLIGSPGWHRHLKRAFGGDLVSVQEYPAVNAQCEKQGAGKNGEVTMVAFPKEVYSWYRSASLHTGKKRIPKIVWLLAAAVVLVPTMFVLAFKTVGKTSLDKIQKASPAPMAGVPAQRAAGPVAAQAISVGDYIKAREPRLPDLPHTAPVYDDVTKPVTAPYPAACVSFKGECRCYTQQGTRMIVSAMLCTQIVERGYFVDWDTSRGVKTVSVASEPARPASAAVAEQRVQTVPMPSPRGRQPGEITQADIPEVLGLRNPAMRGTRDGGITVAEGAR